MQGTTSGAGRFVCGASESASNAKTDLEEDVAVSQVKLVQRRRQDPVRPGVGRLAQDRNLSRLLVARPDDSEGDIDRIRVDGGRIPPQPEVGRRVGDGGGARRAVDVAAEAAGGKLQQRAGVEQMDGPNKRGGVAAGGESYHRDRWHRSRVVRLWRELRGEKSRERQSVIESMPGHVQTPPTWISSANRTRASPRRRRSELSFGKLRLYRL